MTIRILLVLLILCAMVAMAEAGVIGRGTAPNGRAVVLHDTECAKSTSELKRGYVELLAPVTEIQLFHGCYYVDRENGLIEIEWNDGGTSTIPAKFVPQVPTGLTT